MYTTAAAHRAAQLVRDAAARAVERIYERNAARRYASQIEQAERAFFEERRAARINALAARHSLAVYWDESSPEQQSYCDGYANALRAVRDGDPEALAAVGLPSGARPGDHGYF